MIERLIFTALSDGIAEFQNNLDLLERHLQQSTFLDATETAAIRQYFKDRPPRVIHQYAREGDSFPVWAIILGNKREETKFLGDESGQIIGMGDGEDEFEGFLDASEPEAGATELSSIWNFNYQIFVYTEHPDMTIAYAEIAELLLMRARKFFKAQGLLNIEQGANDVAPDARYIPAHLFARRVTFDCLRERVFIGQKEPRAFKVGGIHVEDSTETLEGVTTNVTVGVDQDG